MSAAAPLAVALPQGRGYPIHFVPLNEAPDCMAEAGLRPGRCLVVTDENVAAHYRAPLERALAEAGWSPRVHVVAPGEASKSPEALQAVYDAALRWGIDRQTPVVALGGGVVGDLAGFAAATLLRGVPLVQLPTSLIAQVDSAIGGKTGINHAAGKNLVGAFYQPALVLADTDVLQTLPEREWTSGLAEVVKHALIADADLFAFLEKHRAALLARETGVVAPTIRRAAQVKAEVVSEDELEKGRRMILNFGHTFGHAIERVAGYGTFTHGEAVALGMRAALGLSTRLNPGFDPARADRLVRMIPVPPGFGALSTPALTAAMRTDKKARAGTPRFIVLEKIGAAYVTEAPAEDVAAAWAFAKNL